MTLREITELVKQHHPHMQDHEIRMLVNRASDDFCSKTEIVKATFTIDNDDGSIDTVIDQRYYELPDEILKINSVWLDGVQIPRLITPPQIDDITDES